MEHTSSLRMRMRRAMMAIMTLQPTMWMDGTMMRIGIYQGMKMQPFGWTWARRESRRNLMKQSRGQQISGEASSGRNDPWKESLKVCVFVERALSSPLSLLTIYIRCWFLWPVTVPQWSNYTSSHPFKFIQLSSWTNTRTRTSSSNSFTRSWPHWWTSSA